jgi:hypothetical protein
MTVAQGRLWPAGIISPPWVGAPSALTPSFPSAWVKSQVTLAISR